METVRIKDVAKRANVSVATITRVINNSGYVSPATRAKVLDAIEALDYIPNRMASALKSNQSKIIGNIIPSSGIDKINLFFIQVSNALDVYAQKHGYRVITMNSQTNIQREGALIYELLGRMVDGIVFTSGVLSPPKQIQAILNKNIPVIMIERPMDISGVDKILIDDLDGSAMAARQMLQSGHRHIGVIAAAGDVSVERDRLAGFLSALNGAGIQLPPEMIQRTAGYNPEYGYAAMERLLSGHRRPTACFITSDGLACGAMQYLYRAGIRVPEEMSLIGYDNTLSAFFSPPISSIAFPTHDIGKTAIDLFLERTADKREYGKTITLSPLYMDRGTVVQPRQPAR